MERYQVRFRCGFLLTPLREGRRVRNGQSGRGPLGFLLTPLREGRHGREHVLWRFYAISTHAPAGGATGFSRGECQVIFRISTHAPAGGATTSQNFQILN